MDVEYISLHRYIRNTPSDTEVLADAPAESTGVPEPREKNTQNHTKLGRMKELEEKFFGRYILARVSSHR